MVPRGGFFDGYANRVAELAELSPIKAKGHRTHLTAKFNALGIESAIISAFALGILNPSKIFGAELPRPLAVIMGSMSYRKATQQEAVGVYARTLTEAEKVVAAEFVKLISLNSGLYWSGWEHEVASKVGKTFASVDQTVTRLRQKFGTSNRGEMFYAASRLLEEPMAVRLPHRVEAEFKGLEQDVLLAAAKVLLPAGGYYPGYQDDIADTVHVSKSGMNGINRRIIKKTRAANLGQAVSFSIAYGLITLSQIKIDHAKAPALKAILSAARKADTCA